MGGNRNYTHAKYYRLIRVYARDMILVSSQFETFHQAFTAAVGGMTLEDGILSTVIASNHGTSVNISRNGKYFKNNHSKTDLLDYHGLPGQK